MVSSDEEHLPTVVWQLAWPSVLTMLLQLLNGLVDMFFVGKLGPAAQAAVGMGSQMVILLMAAAMAVTTGATAIVARYAGAGEPHEAGTAAKQALMLAVFIAAAVGLPVGFLRGPVLVAMGAAPEVLGPGKVYLTLTLLAVVPYFALLTLIAVFQGYGDMRTPLAIMAAVNGLNIALDSLLIRGVGPLPGLGIAGAGLASSTARTVGAFLGAALLVRTAAWKTAPAGWRPRREWFARILRIGNPAALQALLRSLGATSYTRILADSPQGTAAVAALFIGLRAEGFGYMPGVAYSRAAATLVGHSLGAGRPDRAERSGWLCTWQALGLMLIPSAGFYFLSHWLAGWFTSDDHVLALAASYLRVNALSEPFLAFAIVLGGALQGAGDTRYQAVVSVLTMWVLRLPLTWWFCLRWGYGAEAAWWVMAGTTVVQALLIAAWWQRGRWKSMQV